MAKTKVNGGNFYLDNDTVKMGKDKILYVAKDLQGHLTDEGVKKEYAPINDAHLTGTTTAESMVVTEEIDCDVLSASTQVVCNGVDILHEIQSLQAAVRELQAEKTKK